MKTREKIFALMMTIGFSMTYSSLILATTLDCQTVCKKWWPQISQAVRCNNLEGNYSACVPQYGRVDTWKNIAISCYCESSLNDANIAQDNNGTLHSLSHGQTGLYWTKSEGCPIDQRIETYCR